MSIEQETANILARPEQNCGSCKWYDADAYMASPDDPPEDRIGECNWPAERLPFSLRYGSRERVPTSPVDGAQCAAHEPREAARYDNDQTALGNK